MIIEYTKAELLLKHYLWDAGRHDENETYELDRQVLDILQGYEVLAFANTFLNRYIPGHTIEDLHNLELALVTTLPPNMLSRHDVAEWLASNLAVDHAAELAPLELQY